MDFTDAIFVKFRYTLPEDCDNFRAKMYYQSILTGLGNENFLATCGYETKNKLNENTHPHLHMHFVLWDKTLGGIRKALQRQFKLDGETRKGNILYSLREEDDIKDVHRFLRYPWKQGGRIDLKKGFNEKLPADFNPDLEIPLAMEEQERMWEFNRKKHEKSLAPNTKDKLFEYLDAINENNKFCTKREILIKIMEYYNQEEKSANQATIMGYLQTAVWRYKLESFEETADRWLK